MNEQTLTFNDKEILENYPLPIAHEYQQLLDKQHWRYQVHQLINLLDYTLRYCLVIVTSDYLGRSSKDPNLNASLIRSLSHPKREDMVKNLPRVLETYKDRVEDLFIPQLYKLCFEADGTRSPWMRLLEQTYFNLVRPIEDKNISSNDEEAHNRLFSRYLPDVQKLLSGLAFLKEYTLVRFIETGGAGTWLFQELKGHKLSATTAVWDRDELPQEPGIAIWGGDPARLLPLYPFALFEECEKCSKAMRDYPTGYSPPEEMFLYQKTEGDQVIYIGLREDEAGVTHRIYTSKTKKDIYIFLNVGEEIGVVQDLRALDWQKLCKLASTQSINQLASYQKEKYNHAFYYPRQLVEDDYGAFLKSDKNGFLLVGESGTGKTNLLCHLVDETRKSNHDIVLFFNCAELPKTEDLNLGEVIASKLGKYKSFGVLLDKIEQEHSTDQNRFLLFLDGLNEYQPHPKILLNSLDRDVLSEVPAGLDWFKVIVSCRSEAWRRLEQHFKNFGQFYNTRDGIEVRLTRFTPEELPNVYKKYMEKFELQSHFDQLNDTNKRYIQDPLMLRFVAESWTGKALPPDLNTLTVFERYYKEKVGNKNDPEMDRQEKQMIRRLVELMYQAKTDELPENDLWSDSVIGQWVLGVNDMTSPYFRMLDKAVLTRIQPQDSDQEYDMASLFEETRTESSSRVRFTYDRFHEFLLSYYLMPKDVSIEQIKKLCLEATQNRYASLWGALKTRLISYAEVNDKALTSGGIIAQLASESKEEGEKDDEGEYWLYRTASRHEIRGLLIDTLVSYAALHPERVHTFLTQVLLQSDSEAAHLVAIFTAYRLKMPAVFEVAYSNPSPVTRDAAVQHTYFYWSRYREEGNKLLDELTLKASKEVKSSLPSEALKKIKGEDLDLARFPLLSAFLNTTLLISGTFLSEPTESKRFVTNILNLYNSFGLARGLVAAVTKRWAGDQLIKAWRSGGVVNMDTLKIFTDRPLNDPLRQKTKEFAPHMGVDHTPINCLEDKLMEMSIIRDGVISLVVVGALVNHSMSEPEATLILLREMFNTRDAMAHYNVIRAMSSALQTNLNPCEGYREFFNEVMLDIWTGEERMVEIKGKKYGLGHLGFPFTFESQSHAQGKIEFVEKFLALPWDGNKIDRIVKVIDELGTIGINAFKLPSVKPYPVLETLKQWLDLDGFEGTDKERVEKALTKALARIWRAYPTEVETYLEDQPVLMMHVYETLRREHGGGMVNHGAQGMTSIVYMPGALPGLVEVLQQICDKVEDVEMAIRMVGGYVLEPKTLERIAE